MDVQKIAIQNFPINLHPDDTTLICHGLLLLEHLLYVWP